MNQLNQHIEALIFCSEQSLGMDEISASLKLSYGWELSEEEILTATAAIQQKYLGEEFPFELVEISGGFQFLTKKDYFPTVNALIQHKAKKKLSVAQMETLSIIAYKQPISKSEIEHIRGVNCDYAIQKLLEKELISISGKSDGPGRPILYSTSESFMDYFGIKSVKDLPQLKDIHVESNEIGQPADYIDSASEPVKEEQEMMEGEMVSAEVEVVTSPEPVDNDSDVREILSPEVSMETEITIVDESDIEIPNRKQIFLENQDNVSDESTVENDLRDEENL
jgi:segregation and condensation protein B